MNWKEWDEQHQMDMENGDPGAMALAAFVFIFAILLGIGAVGGLIWLIVIMIKAYHWAVLWYLGGAFLTVWIGLVIMYLFSSITRLKEPK